MSQEQLQTARELITQKRYADARVLLESIDNPTAQKWLAKLDQMNQSSGVGAADKSPSYPEKPKNDGIQKNLQRARDLIEQKRYDEARKILGKINHPTAEKWLQKLNSLSPAMQPQININTQPQVNVIVNQENRGPGCIVQFIWFIFVGWWATQLWVGIAWLLLLTVIGIPLSIAMIHRVSSVVALRPSSKKTGTRVTVQNGVTTVETGAGASQVNIIIRAIWFLFFGLWLSALWMEIAFFFCCTLIGLPVGLWMFDRTPKILTLRR